ncbi:hypothetical protein U472_11965 [Orenia metallireducens]|jgi:hypothetical protein|uniref:Uncharacterized protein n=1 Tax=Orenia metallireducens TaxID=1413210 RepID=A0A1C0A8Z6_9FIRM|nr:hypothetical protein [Orenia metallireducens]OCL26684.1 hypothetical protein U472_11965 [Orenia metallireducens]
MPELKLQTKKREEALTDMLQSTALEKVALAELFNAGAEEMREVMKMEDITVDKLIDFQGSLNSIIQNGLEVRKILQDDMNSSVNFNSLESNTIEIEEEISEEIIDGKKRIKKIITKKG